MQLLRFLLLLAGLCCYVVANKDSYGYEIVAAYYVYKAEFKSNIPPDQRKMAPNSRRRNGNMLTFRGFCRAVIPGDALRNRVLDRFQGRDTLKPTESDALFISGYAANTERLAVNNVINTFRTAGGNYAQLASDLTNVVTDAVTAGGVSSKILTKIITFSNSVRSIRKTARDRYTYDMLRRSVGADAAYLIRDRTSLVIDWDASFAGIENAFALNRITEDRYQELHDAFVEGRRPTDRAGRSHVAVIQAFQTLSAKATDYRTTIDAGAATVPTTGGGRCDPVVGNGT